MRIQLQQIALASAAACLIWAGTAAADKPPAEDQPGVRVPLAPTNERLAAPSLSLEDSSGKTVRLADYRGKTVLLDFWATWCTGCKKEIPWFVEFSKEYGEKGLVVIGVSLDEEGWKVLRPFLAEHPIPYTVVLGDEATAKQFGIDAMPDTFLIDRDGKIAAAYRGGLVDRQDVDKNLKELTAQ
jgi:cytochrome c biogenesis protein CcmG/thiol:disulfide interchange protein DsbE